MTSRFFLVLISLILSGTAVGQYSDDSLFNSCSRFLDLLKNESTLDELETFFSQEIKDQPAQKIKLQEFLKQVETYIERVEFYVVKINRDYPFYNINFHDPINKEDFGDLQLIFHDNKDDLIDEWNYNNSKSIKTELDKDFKGEIPKPPSPK